MYLISSICWAGRKALWLPWTHLWRTNFYLLARSFDMNLYITLQRLIGLNSSTVNGVIYFGMGRRRVIYLNWKEFGFKKSMNSEKISLNSRPSWLIELSWKTIKSRGSPFKGSNHPFEFFLSWHSSQHSIFHICNNSIKIHVRRQGNGTFRWRRIKELLLCINQTEIYMLPTNYMDTVSINKPVNTDGPLSI